MSRSGKAAWAMPDAPVVLSAVRTPMGRHAGALSGIRPDDLAACAIRAAVARAGVDPVEVEEVAFGIVNASGEAMGNVARFASILAGVPASAAGVSMNRYCGSGLSAVNALAHEISCGCASLGVAGGVEAMSRSTWPVLKPQGAKYIGPIVARDAMWSGAGGPQHPELEANGTMIEMPVGAQLIADEYHITREDMDSFALRSHERAAAAADAGRFDDEIVRVPLPEGSEFSSDETIRRDTSLERLAVLAPYYPGCKDITAGNASTINDGASALVLSRPGRAPGDQAPRLARILATAVVGVDPAHFSIAPVLAIRKLLERTALRVEDIDLFEINEAFASQMIACIRELELDEERVNVNGGAIALGHALGNSGARISVTLIHELRRRGSRYGIAALCVGAGQGIATLFEGAAP
jgi:acetyl-CoA acetyltransferase family protein